MGGLGRIHWQKMTAPKIITPLPGPSAQRVIAEDAHYMSPSYTRSYPLVAKRGRGVIVEDVDGNTFLDFSAGIAVVSTGHCHPEVVAAIQKQAAEDVTNGDKPLMVGDLVGELLGGATDRERSFV